MGSSLISVVPLSGSSALPQEEQNLSVGETFAPQLGQNIAGRDSTTATTPAANGGGWR